jgi:hypothetical protein
VPIRAATTNSRGLHEIVIGARGGAGIFSSNIE